MFRLLLVLCFQLLGKIVAPKQVFFKAFSGLYPVPYIYLGPLPNNTPIQATMKCNQPTLSYGPDINNLLIMDDSDEADSLTFTLTSATTLDNQKWWLTLSTGSSYAQCTVTANINGVPSINVSVELNGFELSIPVHRITVQNTCRVKIRYTGLPLDYLYIDDRASWQFYAQTQAQSYLVNFPQAGDYYLVIQQTVADPDQQTPYSLVINTFCDSLCTNSSSYSVPAACISTVFCGNGILQDGEQCDNGNKPGCEKCNVVAGYDCQGNIGGSSICSKQRVCGDAVFDLGEECDNGNKIGCTSDCKIDSGFKCTSNLGLTSACGFCGNGIVEPGEECDNKNSLGCSQNCKVDVGFACQGLTSSFCYRNNPVCGNGVSEVGEACDDGNKVGDDGCGPTCLIQTDYTCTREPSKCTKKPVNSPVCGNNIYEPDNNERCDNGNKEGCRGCIVQDKWECANQVGSPSLCSPKVVIPHCGNRVYEPTQNQVCDDGNVVDGDGCSSFCQVEFGWVCADNKKCINTQDPTFSSCGNGKVEGVYGENCDDSNKVRGDGCSSDCKVESGWDCRSYGQISNRSFCTKKEKGSTGYCGDGVVDGNEQCDDGFPLRNNDGCNTNCRIEPGWNCGTTAYSQIAKCWRIRL